MKIVYIGDNDFGRYAFRQASGDLSAQFIDFLEMEYPDVEGSYGDFNLAEAMEALLIFQADIYIVDFDILGFNLESNVRNIYNLMEAANSKVIIHAPQYNESSTSLLTLRAAGIDKIITAEENQGVIIEEFLNFISSAEKLPTEKQEELIREREQAAEEIYQEIPALRELIDDDKEERDFLMPSVNVSTLKIGFVGSKTGIGTTTAAIQLVKYLNFIDVDEAAAVYIDMMDSGYIKKLMAHFDYDSRNDELSMTSIGNVPMIEDSRKLLLAQGAGFKYLVCDYGTLTETAVQNQNSLYEKDLIILVGGIKANEIEETTSAIETLSAQRNVFYIMNFVSDRNHESIRDFMGQYRDNTFFLSYVPDPFVLSQTSKQIYQQILTQHKPPEINLKNKKLGRIFR